MVETHLLLFQYNALKIALSKSTVHDEERAHTVDGIEVENVTKTVLRNVLMKTTGHEDIKQTYWENKFHQHFDWDKVYSISFVIMQDSRARELQWKILQAIYPTKVLLCRMKIENSEKCNFCQAVDLIEHFLAECPYISTLWKKVESIISVRLQKKIELNTSQRMLGYCVQTFEKHKWINRLIIVAKLCISKYKYGGKFHPNVCVLFEKECYLRHIDLI